MIQTIAFYLFSLVAVASGIMVIFARNPVHSVLWLILAFFSAAGLFVLLGAEFLAMLLMIVYVGAVAVLFLFVVMMLDIDFAELRKDGTNAFALLFLLAAILAIELVVGIGAWSERGTAVAAAAKDALPNAHAVGAVIYTKYVLAFQASGLILLVAMVGAIVLTLRHKPGVKRQNVLTQLYRTREEAVEMKDVKPGQGI